MSVYIEVFMGLKRMLNELKSKKKTEEITYLLVLLWLLSLMSKSLLQFRQLFIKKKLKQKKAISNFANLHKK